MSEPMFPNRGGREGARAPKAKCTQPKDAIDGFYVYTPKYVSFTTIATLSPAPTSKTDKIELSS
jgi:hypothetical protein